MRVVVFWVGGDREQTLSSSGLTQRDYFQGRRDEGEEKQASLLNCPQPLRQGCPGWGLEGGLQSRCPLPLTPCLPGTHVLPAALGAWGNAPPAPRRGPGWAYLFKQLS